MYYVYLLRSQPQPKEWYVGYTSDLKTRVAQHNSGESLHTAKFRPWTLVAYFAFADEVIAQRFEKYLKSGSGREFARRHFRSE